MVQSPDLQQFQVDVAGVADIAPHPHVGQVYEIGINGVGYMLADNPEAPDTQPAVVVPSLDPPRLATSDTPLSQAVERYILETLHDWSAGAGQRWLNREPSTSRGFWDSEGVDPFSQFGELGLLNTTELSLAETYAGLRVVVVGDDAYALTDTNELTRLDGSTGVWGTPFTISDGGSVQVSDLTSDGQFWYAATGQSIVRGTTTDPAAAWSTENAANVKWAAGRLCAAVVASGSTPNRFTTLSPSGAEEIAGGHLTLDAGHTIVLGGAAAGHFYFGSYVGDRGLVWAWQLGVDSEGAFHVPFVAWEMPQGLIPVAVDTAGGDVWVRAYRAEGPSAGEVSIWRAVPGSGLTPFLVAQLGQTAREGDFDEVGDLVLFSWEGSDGASLGAVSLVTGGYCRWLLAHQPGTVRSVVEWRGLEMFSVAGHGIFVRDPDAYEAEGWFESSTIDGASPLDKVLDSVRIEAPPLLASQEIEIEYSLDGGSSWLDVGTLNVVGAQRIVFPLSQRVNHFTLRGYLRSGGADKTRLFSVQGKYHPLGLRDVVTVVRVKAYDEMVGLNGHPLPENRPGRGAEIMRLLESYGQQRVLFQDIDYHLTGESYVVEVVGVRADRTSLYDPRQGHKVIGGTVELTLRKVGA